MEQKLRYIAYCRRSSDENRERQALSIPAQIDEIKKRFKDIKIVEFIEESHSAFDIGRPKFNEMVSTIQAGKADGIICWHPDRLARNAPDGAIIIHLLSKKIIMDLKFCSYYFSNDPEGIMFLGQMFSQSKYFSDKLSKDVKRGQEKKLRNGQWPGLAPTGYINTYTKARGENEVIPDPERFDLVRKMWDLLLTENYSVPRIQKMANEEWSFRTIKRRRVGGKPIGLSNLYDMLSNPFYCGTIRQKGQYYPGSHKPMVTEEEYDKAQIILGRKGRPRPKTHFFDFTGIIVCGECGASITAEEKTKILKDGSVKHYTYYHCTKHKPNIKCKQKSLEGKKVENFILNELDKLIIDDDFLDYAKRYINELNDQEISLRSDAYKNTEKAYLDTQSHLDRLTKAYYKELIEEDEFVRQRDNLIKEKMRLKKQLSTIDDRANKWQKIATEAFDFAKYAKYWFVGGDIDRRKGITRKLGSDFILKDKMITFRLNKLLEIIYEGKLETKKEVAMLEPEIYYSYSHKLTVPDTLVRVWQAIEESNP